ncbi:hypothetical protein F5B18DRAFT_637326 [Nemania serpens]|nr:hypothetical protein F5B18DRAFT_637326 [Nemania serpens]
MPRPFFLFLSFLSQIIRQPCIMILYGAYATTEFNIWQGLPGLCGTVPCVTAGFHVPAAWSGRGESRETSTCARQEMSESGKWSVFVVGFCLA